MVLEGVQNRAVQNTSAYVRCADSYETICNMQCASNQISSHVYQHWQRLNGSESLSV